MSANLSGLPMAGYILCLIELGGGTCIVGILGRQLLNWPLS